MIFFLTPVIIDACTPTKSRFFALQCIVYRAAGLVKEYALAKGLDYTLQMATVVTTKQLYPSFIYYFIVRPNLLFSTAIITTTSLSACYQIFCQII